MAYATLSSRQYAAPELDSVEITTPGGGGFAPSDWFPLAEEGLDADAVLTGITLRPTFTVFFPGGVNSLQAVIGVGEEEDVTEIAAWPFFNQDAFNAVAADNGLFLPSQLGIDLIPEGVPLWAAIRSGFTNVETYRVAASYLKKPLSGSLLTSTQPQVTIPHAAAPVTVTPGAGAYTDGAAVTIRTGPADAFVATGLAMFRGNAGVDEIELDIFADGELVHTADGGFAGTQGLPFFLPIQPLDAFPEDCEITAVARSNYAIPVGISVYLVGHGKPL